MTKSVHEFDYADLEFGANLSTNGDDSPLTNF